MNPGLNLSLAAKPYRMRPLGLGEGMEEVSVKVGYSVTGERSGTPTCFYRILGVTCGPDGIPFWWVTFEG